MDSRGQGVGLQGPKGSMGGPTGRCDVPFDYSGGTYAYI